MSDFDKTTNKLITYINVFFIEKIHLQIMVTLSIKKKLNKACFLDMYEEHGSPLSFTLLQRFVLQ